MFALADGGNLIPFVINAVWTECKTLKANVRVVSRGFFCVLEDKLNRDILGAELYSFSYDVQDFSSS